MNCREIAFFATVPFLRLRRPLVFFCDRDADRLQKFRDDSKRLQRDKQVEKMRNGGKIGESRKFIFQGFQNQENFAKKYPSATIMTSF